MYKKIIDVTVIKIHKLCENKILYNLYFTAILYDIFQMHYLEDYNPLFQLF